MTKEEKTEQEKRDEVLKTMLNTPPKLNKPLKEKVKDKE